MATTGEEFGCRVVSVYPMPRQVDRNYNPVWNPIFSRVESLPQNEEIHRDDALGTDHLRRNSALRTAHERIYQDLGFGHPVEPGTVSERVRQIKRALSPGHTLTTGIGGACFLAGSCSTRGIFWHEHSVATLAGGIWRPLR
jgi:hypothetical protein